MKRFLVVSLLALSAVVLTSDTASAQAVPGPYGFLPFGFYQPYGARYGNSIRTPPYFATNPPVYYGARHARPYGLSPFASPPLVAPAGNYKSRFRSQFLQPQVPTPQPLCNPCISQSKVVAPKANRLVKAGPVRENTSEGQDIVAPELNTLGKIRLNPFMDPVDRVAKN